MHLKLSVLMPARNAESTIMAAVRSTLRSMPPEAELLVYDDASDDATSAVLAEVRDPRLRVLTGFTNVGIASALNLLIEESRGTYIARMDADDLTLPGRFTLQRAAIRGLDVVFGSTVLFGATTRTKATPLAPLSAEGSRVALLLGNPFAHSTMMARRDVLEDAGGYRPCLAEDYDLWLRIAARGARVGRTMLPAVALRQHRSQTTAAADWAARASGEPEWQEAYLRLAAEVIPALELSERLREVERAGSPEEKAETLMPLLMGQYAGLGFRDRLAVKLLARRGGVSLS
ncbi:glycosyltransferase family 2 protein [Microbacterium arborescens]